MHPNDTKSLKSLTICEQQRNPHNFFLLNPSMQIDEELINCAIFGKVMESEKGTLGHQGDCKKDWSYFAS